MKDTGDSWGFNSMAPVEDKGRLYRFETFSTIDEYLKWAAAIRTWCRRTDPGIPLAASANP